jgi:uncharacterized repeat protein (TIGR01451 family)
MSDTLVPTLTTDLLDYSPGSTATIGASGFTYGGLITFEAQVFAADGTLVDDHVWTVSDDALSDPAFSGSLTTSLSILSTYANTTIQLTATEITAGSDGVLGTADDVVQTAATTFTDNPVEIVPPPLAAASPHLIDLTTSAAASGTDDGVIFSVDNVRHSVGSGLFGSFVRLDSGGSTSTEQGYNTDFRPIDDNNQAGNTTHFNHSLNINDLPIVTVGGHGYYLFALDVSQAGSQPLLSLDALRIYQASAPDLHNFDAPTQQGGVAGGDGFGLSATLVYDLDAKGDYAVLIDANLPGHSGSGQSADVDVLVPVDKFTLDHNVDPYIYVYSAFGQQPGYDNSGGFEEWGALTRPPTNGGGTPQAVVDVDKQISVDGGITWLDQGLYGTVLGSDFAPTVVAGSTVMFQLLVTNNTTSAADPDPIIDIQSLIDDNGPVLNPVLDAQNHNIGDANHDGNFDFHETWVFQGSTTAVPGFQLDTATVIASTTDANGTTIGSNSDSANYTGEVQNPDLSIVKMVTSVTDTNNDNLVDAGDVINYSIVVTNTGNVTLTGVSVTDPLTGGTLSSGVTLAVGPAGTETITTSYTIQQADINNHGVVGIIDTTDDDKITNTATASSDQTQPQDSSVDQPIDYKPDLSIVKSVESVTDTNNDNLVDAGDVINYSIVVTNTGDVTLTGVSVTDPLTGGTLSSGVTLAVGPTGTETLTTSYTIQQADINNHGVVGIIDTTDDDKITNTATASSDQTQPQDSSVDQPIDYKPDLSIVKTVTSVTDTNNDNLVDAGDVINYSIVVTNTGDVTLTGVSVTDPLTGGPLSSGVTLAVGPTGTETLTTSYTIQQGDVDSHGVVGNIDTTDDDKITNTATATSDQTQPQDSSVDQPIDYKPDLSIVKSVESISGSDHLADVGDVITYDITVTNTGNVTLTDVMVTDQIDGQSAITLDTNHSTLTTADDAVLTGDSNNNGKLDVGETWVYEYNYTVTQADIDSHGKLGFIDEGVAANPSQVNGTIFPPHDPSIDSKAIFTAGTDLPATGSGLIQSFVRIDNIGTEEGFNTDYRPAPLDTGSTATFNHSIRLSDIPVVNIGNVQYREFRLDLNEPNNGLTIPLITLEALKIFSSDSNTLHDYSGSGTSFVLDSSTLLYSLSPGTDPLHNPPVVLDDWSTGSGHGDYAVDIPIAAFAGLDNPYIYLYSDFSGSSGGFEEWYVSTNDLNNTATVVTGQTAAASASATVQVASGGDAKFSVVSSGAANKAGDVVTYTATLTNEGGVTLSGFTVTDQTEGQGATSLTATGGDTNNNGKLDVGETWTYKYSHTVTQSDIDSNGINGDGKLGNSITFNSTDTHTESLSADVTVLSNPALSIVTTGAVGDGIADKAGDVVTYTIKVANTGNETLTGVVLANQLEGQSVTAALVSGDTNNNGKLDVGETWTYSVNHTLTQAEINGKAGGDGQLTDLASVTTAQTAAQSSGANVAVVFNPALSVTTTAAVGDGIANKAGDIITYTTKVANTGNVTLTGVALTDLLEGQAAAMVLSSGDVNKNGLLDVGETWIYTLTHTLTQAELDSKAGGDGLLTDTATVTSAQTAALSGSVDVAVVASPALTITKTAVVGDGIADNAGDVITYTLTVKNIGNMDLGGVTVTDQVEGQSSSTLTLKSGDVNHNGILDIGETWTYTSTHTVTQSEIDTKGVNGDGILSSSDTVSVSGQTLGQAPAANVTIVNHFGAAATTAHDATFWNTNFQAWDNTTADDASANLVALAKAGTLYNVGTALAPKVDLFASFSNNVVDSNHNGKFDNGDQKGVLLGDVNGNGLADAGEDVLFVSYTAAKALMNMSDTVTSTTDVRTLLMKQVLAAELNIYNASQFDNHTGSKPYQPIDLVNEAVRWLKGEAPFGSYTDGSSGKVDTNGDGIVGWNSATNTFSEGSAVLATKQAWTLKVDVYGGPNANDWDTNPALAGNQEATGQDLLNALTAFNQGKLVISADGLSVGWNTGTGIFADHSNTLDNFWLTLHDTNVPAPFHV